MENTIYKWMIIGGIPFQENKDSPLVDGWATPLKNSQLGLLFPTELKNKIHVPNHQPDIQYFYGFIMMYELYWTV